ncbi:MAG: hypothetical protein IKL83_06360 [Muribaculaceae bacterium]|nr:hypothetical protein [Muribaculaceae bacterium]
MKRVFVFLFAGLVAIPAFSDGQYREVINDNGVVKGLCTSILGQDNERNTQLNESITSELRSTALYRNYIGYWKIQNDSLFLDSLLIYRTKGDDLSKMELDNLYASLKTPTGYFVNWITDTLRITSGNLVRYEHLLWNSTWENEEFVTVNRGIVTGRTSKHNKLINPQMNDFDLLKLVSNLDLGKIPKRIVLRLVYSGFDNNGQPTGLNIEVVRSCGVPTIDKRVVNVIDSAFMIHKPFPIYLIDGKYETLTWHIPINKRD